MLLELIYCPSCKVSYCGTPTNMHGIRRWCNNSMPLKGNRKYRSCEKSLKAAPRSESTIVFLKWRWFEKQLSERSLLIYVRNLQISSAYLIKKNIPADLNNLRKTNEIVTVRSAWGWVNVVGLILQRSV